MSEDLINYYQITFVKNDKEYKLKIFSFHELLEKLNHMYFDRDIEKSLIQISTIL